MSGAKVLDCAGREIAVGSKVRKLGRASIGEVRGIHCETGAVRIYWPHGDYFTSHLSLRRFTPGPSYRANQLELIEPPSSGVGEQE